jgi:hypothetical protein
MTVYTCFEKDVIGKGQLPIQGGHITKKTLYVDKMCQFFSWLAIVKKLAQ